MDTMSSNQVLKMVSTDHGAISYVQAWTDRTGNELLESISQNGSYIEP